MVACITTITTHDHLARAFLRTLGVHSKWPALSVRYEGAPHGQEQVLRS